MDQKGLQLKEELAVDDLSRDSQEVKRLAEFCPTYAEIMDLLSKKWMGLILRVLIAGPHRFNQIMSAVPGLSDPQLTQRLRELQARDLVSRRVHPESPVRVEYELTEAGRDLERALRALSDWAEKWWGKSGSAVNSPSA